MTPRRSIALAGALAGCALLAACGSGESILQAGNDPVPVTTTTAPGPPPTAAPGETLPETTPPTSATTTTTPLSSLPPCPVDALDAVTAPVELTFWFGLGANIEGVLTDLTNQYNASQDKVHVNLENQAGYKQTIDKYLQSSQDSRPDLVMFPEYMVQQIADSGTAIPIGACVEASGLDMSPYLPRALRAYATEGVQWAMPFNASVPVLYYNEVAFQNAGLDITDPPVTLDELRQASQAIVDSGASGTGIALDSGVDSGGGWFLEQWFARAGEPYADNGNGRLAPATEVLYDGAFGVEVMTEVQSLITDGLAVSVGDNPNGEQTLLKLADQEQPAAMTIATSAALGTIINVLDGGLIPGVTSADLGVGAMPGPGEIPSATVGGGSLYIVAEQGDAQAAAAWDYILFLTNAQSQSTWAAGTGYVPIREDALELDPIHSLYETDPRFKVAYDQVLAGPDDLTAVGPVMGPLREVRSVTAGGVASIFGGADVASTLAGTAAQSDLLITDYNARN
ncbi:MAG: ABC transporter substrate-binding protein [Ilumatobacteraceae bacterium]